MSLGSLRRVVALRLANKTDACLYLMMTWRRDQAGRACWLVATPAQLTYFLATESIQGRGRKAPSG